MTIELWDYILNENCTVSFLNTAHLAHSQPTKSQDWFKWKFQSSPYGKAVMAVALDGHEVIGCVSFGKYYFETIEQSIKAALSYETFVHPDYQGQGLFMKLIAKAMEELKSDGVQVLLNFPNKKSLPGFLKKGWQYIDVVEYWIYPIRWWSLMPKLLDLKKPFVSWQGKGLNLEGMKAIASNKTSCLTHIPSQQYLNWRFATNHAGHYEIISCKEGGAIIRIGNRGRVVEGQVLYINASSASYGAFLASVLKEAKKLDMIDIISFPISKTHPIRDCLARKKALKVPTQTNTTYYALDHSLSNLEFNLSGIDFHTY